mgnify:CR=1 FL=1
MPRRPPCCRCFPTPNNSLPSFYTDQQKYGAPFSIKYSPGLKQALPKGLCKLDFSKYQVRDLTNFREDFYPIVIAIEALFPPSYKGRAKKSIQFTYGTFAVEADNSLRFKFLKQNFLVSKLGRLTSLVDSTTRQSSSCKTSSERRTRRRTTTRSGSA